MTVLSGMDGQQIVLCCVSAFTAYVTIQLQRYQSTALCIACSLAYVVGRVVMGRQTVTLLDRFRGAWCPVSSWVPCKKQCHCQLHAKALMLLRGAEEAVSHILGLAGAADSVDDQ